MKTRNPYPTAGLIQSSAMGFQAINHLYPSADSSFQIHASIHRHTYLNTILSLDYGCYLTLFIVACLCITVLVYSIRRHYPDLHIWP